jgi:hypothetical protein
VRVDSSGEAELECEGGQQWRGRTGVCGWTAEGRQKWGVRVDSSGEAELECEGGQQRGGRNGV